MFLSVEGVRLAQKGYADDIHEEGFAPLGELMDNFAKAGGTIYVCSPCFKKRKLDENNLVAGASDRRRREAGRVPLRRQSLRRLLMRTPEPLRRRGRRRAPSRSSPTRSFDGGDLDCGNGLLLLIRQHIDPLERGQLLEFRSTEISVEEDFPAWCRMTGNELVSLVRRGRERSFLVCKGTLAERVERAAPRAARASRPTRGAVAVSIPDRPARARAGAGDPRRSR